MGADGANEGLGLVVGIRWIDIPAQRSDRVRAWKFDSDRVGADWVLFGADDEALMATNEFSEKLDLASITVLEASPCASVPTALMDSFARLMAHYHGVWIGMAQAWARVAAVECRLALEITTTIFCKLEIGGR